MTVYVNGEIMKGSEAKISVFDHGLLYGDGVFEGIRLYDGCIFKCQEHVDRIFQSAHALRLNLSMTPDEMTAAMVETVKASGLRDGYIRLIATRGIGDLGLDPRKCNGKSVIIIVGAISLYPTEFYENGLSLCTVGVRRNTPAALSPAIKSLNYLNNVMAKMQVTDAGCLEGIMLNHEGYVAECTGDNILLVKNGAIRTPADHCGLLPGITRNAVRDLATKRGIPYEETVLILPDVYAADECFLTGTAAEVVPVVAVDGRTIGTGEPGPITKALLGDFREITTRDGVPVY
ncbi:MAG: branched-chain-amino-acid transaminase [Armatimonadia bacterium]|nr:branched-chain-amino-acid transaminase [Armatimonadia bacterium]